MADTLGILGQITNTAVGTWTAYQVPAAKGARVNFMYYGVAGVNSTFSINVNGIPIFTSAALTSGNALFSTTALMFNTGAVASLTGGSAATTVGVGPNQYLLGPASLVTITIGTAALTSLTFQVHGVEVDNV
jgi:hypothetical protein